ncbi:GroES-like protein [Pilatotrama ljubarskyi]|nr:GroES-like protein [Pilatotrama ljubarskyi]
MAVALPTTQKSLIAYGEDKPYVVGETAVPRPGPKDVLVKIMACALNPADHLLLNLPPSAKATFNLSYPLIPGCDGAGVVVQRGEEVTHLKEGDRILFGAHWGYSGAACQQYATIAAELAAIIPDNLTFEQAASIPLALTTDILVLYNQSPAPENLSLRLKPFWEPEGASAYAGTPAFIVGGAASLGQYAIQLAKLAGHHPIVATASPHNAPLLQSLGVTHVLDRSRSNESILAELSKLTGSKPIRYAFVSIFQPESMRLGRDALAPGGALATVAGSPAMVPEDIANPGDGRRVGDTGVAMFRQLTGWLEKGLLKPNPIEVLPNGLAGIPKGLERMKADKVSGKKLVARPQETP